MVDGPSLTAIALGHQKGHEVGQGAQQESSPGNILERQEGAIKYSR